MPFRLDRARSAGAYLEWKVRLFTVAAVLAVVGMYLKERWMTLLAIPVLLVALFVRFLPGAVPPEEEGDGEEAAGEGDGPAEF